MPLNQLAKHPGTCQHPFQREQGSAAACCAPGLPVPTPTVAQLPGDVVFLAGAVLQQAEGVGAVPGVVGVSAQGIQRKDQVEARAVSKVIEFV